MKKLIAIPAIAVLSVSALCACSPKPNPKDRELPAPRITDGYMQDVTPQGRAADDLNSDGFPDDGTIKPGYPGVRRRLNGGRALDGSYVTEYVHYPPFEERDETLDYKLELRDDDTFTFSVVTKDVSATHEGRWYFKRGGSIVLYYDEPMEEPAHNVYVSDCMYCDVLPGGKIMIYDNCNVIVLAHEQNGVDEPALYHANR